MCINDYRKDTTDDEVNHCRVWNFMTQKTYKCCNVGGAGMGGVGTQGKKILKYLSA